MTAARADIPAALTPIVAAAEEIRCERGRVVLALDGMAAAGKTTAAAILSRLWDAPVVHMDDFFLPAALRTEARLAEPGGNVHYERFAAEVLPGLLGGGAFSYGRFSCARMALDGEAFIPASPVVIVEGAYAMHPRFGDYADVTTFFSVSPPLQKLRVTARGGEEAWENFQKRWIPMENAYHTAFSTRERAMFVVEDFSSPPEKL